jgi:branched-chain amino acid transport system ATP-binding protein
MSAGIAIEGVVAGYGATIVLDGVSLTLAAGGTLALLGRNGVGKSTLLKTIMGDASLHAGTVSLGGAAIEKLPTHLRVDAGLGYVPQEREIFPSLSAEENLAVAMRPDGWSLPQVYALFPQVRNRRHVGGSRLSGGEQQMLAIGRALVGGPKMLLLDEPMEGLAPTIVENVYDTLSRIRDSSGMTIILVEQKADLALAFAEEVAVLDRGRIVHRGRSADLRANTAMQAQLLGMGGGADTAEGSDVRSDE